MFKYAVEAPAPTRKRDKLRCFVRAAADQLSDIWNMASSEPHSHAAYLLSMTRLLQNLTDSAELQAALEEVPHWVDLHNKTLKQTQQEQCAAASAPAEAGAPHAQS